MKDFRVTFENSRWLVDGKRWENLNYDQKMALENFFVDYRLQLEDEKEVLLKGEQLRTDVMLKYKKLGVYKGAKHQVAKILGCHGNNVRQLLAGEKTTDESLLRIKEAIEQASINATKKINQINVEITQ